MIHKNLGTNKTIKTDTIDCMNTFNCEFEFQKSRVKEVWQTNLVQQHQMLYCPSQAMKMMASLSWVGIQYVVMKTLN